MSSQNITVTLDKRETLGKGLGQLRRDGRLPAVIHQPGDESVAVSGSYVDLYKMYLQAGKHHPVELKVDGKSILTIVKDVHFEPRKNQIQHIVFGVIKQNKKVETEVPLEFVGQAEAQRLGLAVLEQLDSVEVAAFPRDLPDSIAVQMDALVAIGDRITVGDLVAPKGVQILTDAEQVIVAVEESKTQTEEEQEVADVESVTEPAAA